MGKSTSSDRNQAGADQVRQRGMDATVDLGQEPDAQQSGVEQEKGAPKQFSGDVHDTVNDDVEESPDDGDRSNGPDGSSRE